jgi:transcription termination factor NusB
VNEMDHNVLIQLKDYLINALQCPHSQLAKLISNSIVTILRLKGIANWSNIIQLLYTLLISSNPNIIQNTLFCLEQIYEDIEEIYTTTSEDFKNIVKSLVSVLSNKELSDEAHGCALRLLAFSYSVMKGEEFSKCVPSCISMMSEHMQVVIKGGDIGESVKIGVSKLAIEILKDRKEEVVAIYKLLFSYHLVLLNTENDKSFLISCDFWNEYIKSEWSKDYETQKWNCLNEALPELVPKLLSGLKYTKEDLESLIDDTEDDIKLKELNSTYENIEAITVRQLAFSLLETLANTYRNTVLTIIKPLIDNLLNQDNWVLR